MIGKIYQEHSSKLTEQFLNDVGINPEDILTEGHQSELVTYKGVMVSKEHSDKDIFKINLLNMLQK